MDVCEARLVQGFLEALTFEHGHGRHVMYVGVDLVQTAQLSLGPQALVGACVVGSVCGGCALQFAPVLPQVGVTISTFVGVWMSMLNA